MYIKKTMSKLAQQLRGVHASRVVFRRESALRRLEYIFYATGEFALD